MSLFFYILPPIVILMLLFTFLVIFLLSCTERSYIEKSKIPWLEDYDRAVEMSKRSGKPLFIYFSAIWCSWCREYEKELEEERIVRLLRKRFVPLILDSDRDRRLFLKFGGRGTPFTVVLSPEGRVLLKFHGAVKARDLEDMLTLASLSAHSQEEAVLPYRIENVSREVYRFLLEHFLGDLRDRFDPTQGGFSSPSASGRVFKWSTPLTYSYLLEKGIMREEVLFSLKKDIEFLYDPVDGGFFNFYDRTRAFDFYFETSKTLRVNSKMIIALLKAYRTSGELKFLKTAEGTARYLLNTLYHGETGCFLNAQISDPAYYNLPPEERRKRKPPPTDTAIIVEDNSWTIIALLELWKETGEDRFLKTALKCARYIKENLLSERGIYRYYDVKTREKGLLNFDRDVALWSFALLRLSEIRKDYRQVFEEFIGEERSFEDWMAVGIYAFVLSQVHKDRAVNLLKGLEVDLSYHNPDDMVFLLKALENLVERNDL